MTVSVFATPWCRDAMTDEERDYIFGRRVARRKGADAHLSMSAKSPRGPFQVSLTVHATDTRVSSEGSDMRDAMRRVIAVLEGLS